MLYLNPWEFVRWWTVLELKSPSENKTSPDKIVQADEMHPTYERVYVCEGLGAKTSEFIQTNLEYVESYYYTNMYINIILH